MPGIGEYTKGKKFQLRSGNKPSISSFKMMGSTEPSPYKENTDAEETNVTETSADKIVAAGDKIKKGLATAGKAAFAGFTGGLKEVYGTDAYKPTEVKFYDKDKDKGEDEKTGQDKVNEQMA